MKKMYKHFTLLIAISSLLLAGCGKNNNNKNKPKEGTVLYRSYQLANNIENLPSTKDIYDNPVDESHLMELKRGAIRDETYPSDDVNRSPAYHSYYSSLWESVDGLVNDSKDIKNYVIKNIYSLNTWITSPTGDNIRLNYDVNKDAAIIETMFEESESAFSYRYIYTTYDEEGRMLIDSVWYVLRYENNQLRIVNKDSVSYVEGLYWDFTELETQRDVGPGGVTYNYVIHADLTKQEKEITQIRLQKVYRGDGTIDYVNVNPSIQTTTEHLNFVTNNDNDGHMDANMYDKKGYNYIQCFSSIEGQASISIPLYRLEGFDKIENHYRGEDIANGTRYFTVGNNTYGGQRYEYNGLNWFVDGMIFGPGIEPAITIELNYSNYTEGEVAQLIRDFLSSIGLHYKQDYLDEAFHLELNKKQMCEEREAFGKKNYLYISEEEFNTLYEHYDFNNYTVKDLQDYLDAEKVDLKKQTKDEEYYSLVNSTATGSYTFDIDNEKLSLGEVTLNVEKSALLDRDIDYVGVVALKSGREIITLQESDVVHFDGANDITTTIPVSSYNIKDLPSNNDESFEVVAYLAIKDDNNLSRCSSVSLISYVGGEVEYIISTYDSRDHKEEKQNEENKDYVIKEYFSIVRNNGKAFNKHYFTTETILERSL